jgi:peptidoglycan hydrolase CwlO-like protein
MVQEVMNLLLGLQTHAEEDLVAENARWKIELARLTATLNHLITVRNDQQALCTRIQEKIDNLNNQIDETRDQIRENNETMAKQAAELKELLESRCSATTLYIRNLNNNR